MILTIAQKYGSGGREIGQSLAERLDLPFYSVDPPSGGPDDSWREKLLSLAEAGPCILSGFCAGHVLADHEGLLRVFIHCDMSLRVQRIMRTQRLSEAQAQREALHQDRERARLYGFYTGKKWTDLDRYDLTVNSGLLGVRGSVELLSQFVALNLMRRRRGG